MQLIIIIFFNKNKQINFNKKIILYLFKSYEKKSYINESYWKRLPFGSNFLPDYFSIDKFCIWLKNGIPYTPSLRFSNDYKN